MDDALRTEVLRLLAAGEKIGAVKVWRERTGASLLDAKNAVDALESGGALAAVDAPPTNVAGAADAQIAFILRTQRDLIAAVKHVRETEGSDLSTALARVRAVAAREGLVEFTEPRAAWTRLVFAALACAAVWFLLKRFG